MIIENEDGVIYQTNDGLWHEWKTLRQQQELFPPFPHLQPEEIRNILHIIRSNANGK